MLLFVLLFGDCCLIHEAGEGLGENRTFFPRDDDRVDAISKGG